MILIEADKLPFSLPSNQILYVEREYNEVLNSLFQNTEIYQELFYFDKIRIRQEFLYGEAGQFNFIYIPQLVKQWSKESDRLKESLHYHYPDLDLNTIDLTNSLNIDTVSYTRFFSQIFDHSDLEQITNGLLIYSYSLKMFLFCSLEANNSSVLLEEIRTFFENVEIFFEGRSDDYENFSPTFSNYDRDEYLIDGGFDHYFIDNTRKAISLLIQSGHEKLLLRLIMEEVSKVDQETKLKSALKDVLCLIEANYEHKISKVEAFKKHYLTKELSTINIDQDYRIFLPEYNNLEIKMTPLPKAVYFLFLRHPEGIMFKNLSQYKHELHYIYNDISNRENIDGIGKSIDDICNPVENSINEKCSRIKEAFLSQFEDEIANNYYITGNRGCPKLISLDRTLVKWNTSFSYDDSDYFIIDDLDYENF
ncbi:hypothetical protein CLV62_10476 [Dysgonomonas alginatilytica]|uniref:Uncharacterized protein n=1 Tax=Dysgonomonas alginatilytica TaxID=1605892 RepID=A0A2V3PRJ9_9BACT|nr:hypothetical protein [Dysgonomonas alginatilytica]PXV66816.1 hypothetical protein CLV62_10476 [Dysgonomonas alginatilytica]